MTCVYLLRRRSDPKKITLVSQVLRMKYTKVRFKFIYMIYTLLKFTTNICGQVQTDYFSNVFQFDPNAIIFENFG